MTPALHRDRQLALNVRVKLFAPLATLETAQSVLQTDAQGITAMIDTGAIAWAWDIGLGEYRAELRIYTPCLESLSKGESLCGLAEEKFDNIIARILAREQHPFIKSPRLGRLLLASPELIIDLIKDGELEQLGKTRFKRGRNGAALITRASVIKFLKQRRKQ